MNDELPQASDARDTSVVSFAPVRGIPPAFEDFPADVVAEVQAAPVNLESHPEAPRFRTLLSRGAAQGPNFAGYLTVVTFGCGTMCQRAMILDAATGRVVASLTAPLGFQFQLGSRLLVSNPASAVLETPCPTCQTGYHLWEDTALIELSSESWWGTTPPPARERALITQLRSRERAELARPNAAGVQRTGWDRLVVRARNGSTREFSDEVVGDELRRLHRFAGPIPPLGAYLVEAVFVPEGRQFLLVDGKTGAVTEIDGPPTPSPDARRFVTANMDLIAGHTPNRVRIYRVGHSGPEVEWEVQPTDWGAQNPRWLDTRTIELERGSLNWETQQITTSTLRLEFRDSGWKISGAR